MFHVLTEKLFLNYFENWKITVLKKNIENLSKRKLSLKTDFFQVLKDKIWNEINLSYSNWVGIYTCILLRGLLHGCLSSHVMSEYQIFNQTLQNSNLAQTFLFSKF